MPALSRPRRADAARARLPRMGAPPGAVTARRPPPERPGAGCRTQPSSSRPARNGFGPGDLIFRPSTRGRRCSLPRGLAVGLRVGWLEVAAAEVVDRGPNPVNIVLEVSDAEVAGMAQEPSYATGGVRVVDAGGALVLVGVEGHGADRAGEVLPHQESFEVFEFQLVVDPQPALALLLREALDADPGLAIEVPADIRVQVAVGALWRVFPGSAALPLVLAGVLTLGPL